MCAIYKPQTQGCLGSIWVVALHKKKKSQKAIYRVFQKDLNAKNMFPWGIPHYNWSNMAYNTFEHISSLNSERAKLLHITTARWQTDNKYTKFKSFKSVWKTLYKYSLPSSVIGSKRYQRKARQTASNCLVYISFPFVLYPRVSFFPKAAVPSTAYSRSITHLSLGDGMFNYSCVTIRPQKICNNNIFSMARKGFLPPHEWLRSTRIPRFSLLAINKSAWEEKCYIINIENPECKVREFYPSIHLQMQRHDSLNNIMDSSVHKHFRVFRGPAD
jgi:hypothetical protein